MRWRVTNGIDSAVVTAADEASAMRVFWRGLVARRLPTYNGQTTATAIGMREGPVMAKMTAAQKKAFLKRMSAGRVKAGKASPMRAKSAGQLRSYVVEDERTERVLGTYRAASPSAAITACMRRHPGHSRANLSAHVMPLQAGRVTGRKVTRKGARKGSKRRAGSAAMVHAGAAMPARTGRQSGAMGTGTPVARLQRVESAVMDLARANHAVVAKVVEHERRLNSVESTLSNWAKGRR